MYEKTFGLTAPPFGVTADPRFLYESACHREALAVLKYGVGQRRGFVCLIGEAGTGKSTLLRALLEEIDVTTKTILITHTTVDRDELLKMILHDARLEDRGLNRVEMLRVLNTFVLEEAAAHRPPPVLIIDEAHNLSEEALEEIRLLTNLETSRGKLLQVILAGQPELAEKLSRPGLRQLRQRISVRARLRPLEQNETAEYVVHRLKKAGASQPNVFSSEAIRLIWKASGGVPRYINHLCEQCLLNAYALGKRSINAKAAAESIRDLGLDSEVAPFSEPLSEPQIAAPLVQPMESTESPIPEQPAPVVVEAAEDQQQRSWWLLVAAASIVVVTGGIWWLAPFDEPLANTGARQLFPQSTSESVPTPRPIGLPAIPVSDDAAGVDATSDPVNAANPPDAGSASTPTSSGGAAAEVAQPAGGPVDAGGGALIARNDSSGVDRTSAAQPQATDTALEEADAPPVAAVVDRPASSPDTEAAPFEAAAEPAPPGPHGPIVVAQVPPNYPDLSRRLGVGGAVRVGIFVDERGQVATVVPDESNIDPELRDAAVAAASSWSFEPAIRDDRAVPSWTYVRFEFDGETGEVAVVVEPGQTAEDRLLADGAEVAGAGEASRAGTADSQGAQTAGDQAIPPQRFQAPVAIERIVPVYPPAATRQNLQGAVQVRMLVDASGRVLQTVVETANVHPLLEQAAVEAAYAWRFQPALLNDQPTEAWTLATFEFERP